MTTPQLSPGTVVADGYTVGEAVRTRVGATIYAATDKNGNACQVTHYAPECFPSGLVLERSVRELKQLQSVQSDRVARVFATGKHPSGGAFEVTETLPQTTLADVLAARPVGLQDAASIVVQVGEALLEAQRVGVIHRNLGADVIFPSENGVKVTGFAVGEPHGPPAFGPLQTMAPEQVQGKVVDQRTLIYNIAALMQWMLSGQPLFSGDAATILQHHTTTEPPADLLAGLTRALGKDPRMRPMMLKQFLTELASAGGVQPPSLPTRPRPTRSVPGATVVAPSRNAPAGATMPAPGAATADAAPRKPSTRGWTMFMKAADDDAPPPSQSAPAVAPPDAPKPSTRGWTMFMQDEEGKGSAPAESPPQEAGPTPVDPAPPDAVKPSTRGWTMFMQAQDEAAPDEAEPSGPPESPAAAASPAPAEPTPPPSASTSPEKKPSTRGWTMFMTEDEKAQEGKDSAPVAPVPSAPVSAIGDAGPGPGPDSSARGWTMFEDKPPGAQPTAPQGAPQPAARTPAAAAEAPQAPSQEQPQEQPAPAGQEAAGGPSSRGWTMFMEPKAKTPADVVAAGEAPAQPQPGPDQQLPQTVETARPQPQTPQTAETPVQPSQTSESPAQPGPAATSDPASGEKKRGWTMFMDAPLPKGAAVAETDAPQAARGVGGPDAPTKPVAQPMDGSSDNRGWTVFGADAMAPGAPAPEPAAPPADRTVISSEAPTAYVPEPAPAGEVPTETGQGKTVVAAGVQAQPADSGGVTGRTVFPGAGGTAAAAGTQYSKRGSDEMKARRVTARDLDPPHNASGVQPSGVAPPSGQAAIARGQPRQVAKSGSSLMIVIIVLAVGVVVGAGLGAYYFIFS